MAATLQPYLKKNKQRKNGEYPIYIRITSNRKYRFISTGVTVDIKCWNPDKKKVRKNHRNNKALNKIIQKKLDEATEAIAELNQHGKHTAKAVKERIEAKQNADFFSYATDYLEEKKSAGLHSQHVQGTVAFNKVEEFEGDRYLPFKHIDADYLDKFQKFLQNTHNNKASTIKKTFQPIKKVIRRAIGEHLIHVDPFINFEIVKNTNPPKKAKLHINQIRGIEQLDMEPGSWLWNTRCSFLFSFYSGGVRFGDVCCLKWENVKGGRLTYQMNKNEKSFSSELNIYQKKWLIHALNHPGQYFLIDKTEAIDNKHSNVLKYRIRDSILYDAVLAKLTTTNSDKYIFPFLNDHRNYSPITLRQNIGSKNAVANKNLKTIAKLLNKAIDDGKISAAKIDQKVSFHVSRHSFAQHAVESGLDVYELMQTLRHSKLETTQKYLKSLDEELADKAMKKVF